MVEELEDRLLTVKQGIITLNLDGTVSHILREPGFIGFLSSR